MIISKLFSFENYLYNFIQIKKLICLIAILLVSIEPVFSWNYKEHAQIGYEAYKLACQELLNDKSITGESFIFLNKIICKDIEIQAKKYGQSVALAGDYLSNPNKFLKDIDKGLREANDPFNYGRLALKNSYHFHPEVILKWRKYHLQALSIARSLKKKDNYLNNIDIFEKALYTNAFADHYLYDSFASGHMGFNRPSSRPTTSKTHHDFWNYAGRFLKDGNNHIWYGMGDDYLNTERNKYGKEHLLLTAKESIINLLRTCITRQNYDREEMLFLNLPKAYLDPKVNKWLIDEDKKNNLFQGKYLDPNQDNLSDYNSSEYWIQLDLFSSKTHINVTFECYYMSFDYLDGSGTEFIFPMWGITFIIPRQKTRLKLSLSNSGTTKRGYDGFYDIGLVIPLFYKHPSALSYDIIFGLASRIGEIDNIYYSNDSYYLGLCTNLEIGIFNIFFSLAPAFISHRGYNNSRGLGYFYSFGVSAVIRSKGGNLLIK